jgi:hypothetical protein
MFRDLCAFAELPVKIFLNINSVCHHVSDDGLGPGQQEGVSKLGFIWPPSATLPSRLHLGTLIVCDPEFTGKFLAGAPAADRDRRTAPGPAATAAGRGRGRPCPPPRPPPPPGPAAAPLEWPWVAKLNHAARTVSLHWQPGPG